MNLQLKTINSINILASIIGNKIPNRLIYGNTYKKKYIELIQSQYFNEKKIRYIQFAKLKSLVTYCYNNNKFYSAFYRQHGFSPDSLKDLSDLIKIPSTNKLIVKENIQDIAVPLSLKYFVTITHTGGTSSTPMHFPETLESKIFERVFYSRFFTWHELNEAEIKISFKGGDANTNKDFRYNPFLKSFVFIFSDISDERFIRISRILQKIQPKAIVSSYPSLVYAYARMINKGKIPKLNSIEKIFCSSEMMHSYQIKEIKTAFSITPVDSYGHNERVSLIQQCPKHQYHIIPEYGITEILDEKNLPVLREGEIGEITSTGFLNRAFPLIRYKTDDFAVLGQKHLCECGLPFKRIKKIHGRCGDFLKTDNGKLYSAPIIEFTIDNFHNVKDIQLVQNRINNVTILLCPDNNFSSSDGKKIITDLTNRTHQRIKYNLKIVNEIVRPKNLKKRLIVSSIEN